MSKRKIDLIKLNPSIVLLGVFMANFWVGVMHTALLDEDSDTSLSRERTLSPSELSDVDLAVVDRQDASYPESTMSENDKGAFNWVEKYGKGIAKYLLKQGVTVVSFGDIDTAFKALRGTSLKDEAFIDEDTEMYIQGAVQGYLDAISMNVVYGAVEKPADQFGVDAWIHAHGQDVVSYLESNNITFVGSYGAIVKACKDLGITPLATKKVKAQERIIDAINNLLDEDYELLQDDAKYAHAILFKLRSEGKKTVTKKDLLQAAKKLNLPKDYIARLDAIPEAVMNKIVAEFNQELNIEYDPKVIGRALDVLANVQVAQSNTRSNAEKARSGKVARAINVISAVQG